MSQNCLVIGGNGFIGSHLVRRLCQGGRTVTSLDARPVQPTDELAAVTYITGDYGDRALMEKLVATHQEIIHLAYATQPNTSFDDPLTDLLQNLPATVQLFELAAKHQTSVLFVSSGGTVYGDSKASPIVENHPTVPISPYGVTKLTLEKYAHLYAKTKGLKVCCVRPSNPFGPGQRPFSGQGFVSTAIALAMQGKAIPVFGAFGTIRDYLYIDDLIEGIITVMQTGYDDEIYNIGSGIGRSNMQVLRALQPRLAQLGISMEIHHLPERPFDVKCNVLDTTKLQNLGWQPSTDFNDGLDQTVRWLLDNRDQFQSCTNDA